MSSQSETPTEAIPAPRPAQRARVASLYAELQPQLRRILATNLTAPDWLYEEACQTA